MLPSHVGREEALIAVREALSSSRWVTVVGPPGCGKTRLAREVLRDVDHVWVSIQHLTDTDSVVSACLNELGVEASPGEDDRGTLFRALEQERTLLVLDGAEGDHQGLAGLLEEIIGTTSRVTLLATAATVAGTAVERVVRVDPLPLPGPGEDLGGPALTLLDASVEQAGGRPVDVDADPQAIRAVLEASGGLPFVLEQMGAQIALVGLANVVPTATPSEAVRASYEILGKAQRRCFRRVALIDVPFSADALAEVMGVPRGQALEWVSALVRRSLVQVGQDGRFGMLAPIRRQGAALAGQDDRTAVHTGLLVWADRMLPTDMDLGAANAPWLADRALMRIAIASACGRDETRDVGYRLANRAFGALYTAMHAREAVDILETTLASGDGPADIGAQLARRAGISASEVRGTYAGLDFLDRADKHADQADHPEGERARTASIRAEMHLDAGVLDAAAEEATRVVTLDADGYATRQARRTLMDVHVSRGEFSEAEAMVPLIVTGAPGDEAWIGLAARVLLARIAFEQGRRREASATARAIRDEALAAAENRVALLADTLLRTMTGAPTQVSVDRDRLPWAVRLSVLTQDVRDLAVAAAEGGGGWDAVIGQAARAVALADSATLGRDAVDARIVLGDALLAAGDGPQAAATYVSAARAAWRAPMPLRVADALDGLAAALATEQRSASRACAGTAREIRAAHGAVRNARVGLAFVTAPASAIPEGWIEDGRFTAEGLEATSSLLHREGDSGAGSSVLDQLTAAQRAVAELTAEGLTSRQIAERLVVSPRTVETHLAHIYRRLGITSRSRLAAIVADERPTPRL